MSSARELAFEQARTKWPGVALDFGAWNAHLDTLGWATEPPLTAGSLFLCCACARQDAEACRSLDDAYLSSLRGVVARENADDEFIDWVLQSVRQQLLGGNSPQIASYDGRRPLADWLRLFVRRVALAQKLADRASTATPPVPAAEVRRIKVAQ